MKRNRIQQHVVAGIGGGAFLLATLIALSSTPNTAFGIPDANPAACSGPQCGDSLLSRARLNVPSKTVTAVPLSIARDVIEPSGAAVAALGLPETPVTGSVSEKLLHMLRLPQAHAHLLQLRSIRVEGAVRLEDEQIVRSIGMPLPIAITDLWDADLRGKLLSNPWIDDAELTWSVLPLRLTVAIRESTPWLVAEYGSTTWLVSRSGKLLQTLESITDPDIILETADLARLDGLVPAASESSLLSSENARLRYAVKTLGLYESAGGAPFAIERFTLQADGAIELVPADFNLPHVLMKVGTYAEAAQSLKRMSFVLADIKRRGEKPSVLDLRFENQAVVR